MENFHWDDLLREVLGKSKDDDVVYDPGLVPDPHLNERYYTVMPEPDALSFHQLRCEVRNYTKAATDEIECLKTEAADICSELYRQGNEIAALREAINALEPVKATPWYKNENVYVYGALALLLVVMWLAGGRAL